MYITTISKLANMRLSIAAIFVASMAGNVLAMPLSKHTTIYRTRNTDDHILYSLDLDTRPESSTNIKRNMLGGVAASPIRSAADNVSQAQQAIYLNDDYYEKRQLDGLLSTLKKVVDGSSVGENRQAGDKPTQPAKGSDTKAQAIPAQ